MQEPVFQTVFNKLPPSVNKYMKPSATVDDDGNVKAHLYETAESKSFKREYGEHLKRVAKHIKWDKKPTKDGFWILECTFIQKRTNEDNNNYYKILCDTLEEYGIIDNDKNILVRTERVLYNSKMPMFSIKLYKSEYIGVFEGQYQLNDFELKNCFKCSKDKSKCTIFKDSIKGKMRSEINLLKLSCDKLKERKS